MRKAIVSSIQASILDLNLPIPIRNQFDIKSTNASNLLKWIEEEQVSDSKILNLLY